MATYQETLNRVYDLSQEDRLRLLEELAAIIRRESPPKPQRSIRELRGLGKELWRKIDVDAYIEQERSSWDG